MGYLLWFGIVVLAFVLMHYFTALSGKQKGIISLILTVVIGNIIVYTILRDLESKHIAQMELKYHNGETIQCNGVPITSKEFSYSVGTQSFIGNKESRYAQQIFSASECR